MLPSKSKIALYRQRQSYYILGAILGLCLLLIGQMMTIRIVSAKPTTLRSHTFPTVNTACNTIGFSPDGNPYPLCPGPSMMIGGLPRIGGNCVWWAWEQWHLLGYNLPLNWGNAADWIVGAERSGFSVGKVPRVGAIAVFPRGDGVWAYGPQGHVAFVSNVYPDEQTFDVTYQNYGDPTPMYLGKAYNVSVIDQPEFQDGEMGFIYFPQMIDAQRFMSLPGIRGVDPQEIMRVNTAVAGVAGANANYTDNRLMLGFDQSSTSQEFDADFTGTGLSELLLYNRHAGQLMVLRLGISHAPGLTIRYTRREPFHEDSPVSEGSAQELVSLGDKSTPSGKWGSDLDVHVGHFAGAKAADILLYNHITGTIQLISLNADFSIKKHMTLPGYGPGWELAVGQFDGKRSGIFLYNRFAAPISTAEPAQIGGTPSIPVTIVPAPSLSHAGRSTTRHHTAPRHSAKKAAKAKPGHVARQPSIGVTPTPPLAPRVTPTQTVAPSGTGTAPATTPTTKPTEHAIGTPASAKTATSRKLSIKFVRPQIMLGPAETIHVHTTRVTVVPQPLAQGGLTDLSGTNPSFWETEGRSPNIYVLDFNQDFRIRNLQQYTLWHGNWEVYTGRFSDAKSDGIFLFDRDLGEGRLLDFDAHMRVNHYQMVHNLEGNWVVYSGDFMGQGRSQLLLYDPSSGKAEVLVLDSGLGIVKQKTYSNWKTNQVLYVGHFGMSALSLMLYEPQCGQSTFIGFNHALDIVHRYTVKSWNQNWQILVGAFLDHSDCAKQPHCMLNDNILVLNRKSGQMEQYAFSFGPGFQLYDNRLQAFERLGLVVDTRLSAIGTSGFDFVSVLHTSIRNEELY